MSLSDLLDQEPVVATAGIDLLADALEQQAVRVGRAVWRPPAAGTQPSLDLLATVTAGPNDDAMRLLLGSRPMLVGVERAGHVIPDLSDRMLLHAGPPIEWNACSGPLRGALIGGIMFEGWADSPGAAARFAETLSLSPCHDHDAVGPMAGVVTPSMPMAVIEDAAGEGRAYVTLNEGLGRVLRYGAFSPDVIDRLRWMSAVLGPVLGAALARHGPLDLHALIAQALHMGDDGHNRNRAGTSLLLRAIGGALLEGEGSVAERAATFRFIESNDHFMLNLVMGAAKLSVDAASDVKGSSLVTTMTRNGTEFGIRLAGTGRRWFTAAAPHVDGMYLGSYRAADANPDIGDSAITETVGLGGFAMAASPAIAGFVGGTAADAVRRTLAMYEITLAEHPTFRIPILEFRGSPVGIDATRVARTGVLPQINTGIAGKDPGVGMVGAGLVEAPMDCFVAAVRQLARLESV